MLQTGLLIFIALWVVLAGVARIRENRKFNALAKPMVDKNAKEASQLLVDVSIIKRLCIDTASWMKEVAADSAPIPEGANRVYAAILRQGQALRLNILPAESVQEFTDKSQIIVGPGWKADIIEFLDVYPAKEKVVYRAPNKAEKKEMGLTQGLYFLEMAKDKYAPTQKEKSALDAVITNYKKIYELA